MATQDKVALKLASKIIEASGDLLEALSKIEEAYQWGVGVGINFTDFSSVIAENGDTQHTEPTYLNQASAVVAPALSAWLDTQTSGANKYRAILQHNRK